MKIATWNVNGIRARAGQVEQWLDVERPDVLCLQEIDQARMRGVNYSRRRIDSPLL